MTWCGHPVPRTGRCWALLVGILCLAAMLAGCGGGEPGVQASGGQLLVEAGSQEAQLRYGHDPAVLRSRTVALNPQQQALALAPQTTVWTFPVSLFGEQSLTLVMDRSEWQDGTRVWAGKVRDLPGSLAILAVNTQAVSGSLVLPAGNFQITGLAEGLYGVLEVRSGAGQPCGGGLAPPRDAALSLDVAELPGAAMDETGTAVDVLVAYTTAARGTRTVAQMEARVAQAIGEWNLVLVPNSRMARPTMNLVHTVEVDYTQHATDLSNDLYNATLAKGESIFGYTDTEGVLDNLLTLRDQYRADLVHLVVARSTNASGISWRPHVASLFTSTYGVAVSADPYLVAPNFTFCHESGHNFGAQHGNDPDGEGTTYPTFNRGFWTSGTAMDSNSWGTLMTYAMQYGRGRLPYLSNPSLTYPASPPPGAPVNPPPTGTPLGGNLTDPDSETVYVANAAQGVSDNAPLVADNKVGVAAPTNLAATVISATQNNLSWTDNSDNETGFRIERRTAAGSYSSLGTVGANVTTCADTNVATGTSYTYRVQAFDAVRSSGYSNEVSTSPAGVPAPPSGLTAKVTSPAQVDLAWTDASDNETGFRIQRRTGTGTYAQVATVGAGVTSWSNPGLVADTAYTWRVQSYNDLGSSPWSNEASATPINPPAAPTGLTATVQSGGVIRLTWTDNASSEEGFRLEFKTGSGAFAQFGTSSANSTGSNVTGCTPGVMYTFRVLAYNLGGNSAHSNEASATVPVAPTAPRA